MLIYIELKLVRPIDRVKSAAFQHFFYFWLTLNLFSALGHQTGLNCPQFSLRIFSIRYRHACPLARVLYDVIKSCRLMWLYGKVGTIVNYYCLRILTYFSVLVQFRIRHELDLLRWKRFRLNNNEFIANPPLSELFLARNRKWNGSDIFDKMLFEFEKNSLK